MTPADERVLKLLHKWQVSLDLHARYADLPDDQYWMVQPWPNHQRPTRWVIDLARQRLADLQQILQGRLAQGDPSLSEALELMSFLTNLTGAQLVERYVPLAEPEHERPLPQGTQPQQPPAGDSTGSAPTVKARAARQRTAGDTTVSTVVKDAARLLSWGREWHELPDAIGRMAGRPDQERIRQILRNKRTLIEQRAARQDPG